MIDFIVGTIFPLIIIKFYLKSILIKHYNTSSNELFKSTTYKIQVKSTPYFEDTCRYLATRVVLFSVIFFQFVVHVHEILIVL